MKTKIFIGSSSEKLDIASSIQSNLEKEADVTIWNQGVFNLSESNLDSLIKALKDFDFAVFLLTADDIAMIRNQTNAVTRDNIIFELGLFIGYLGKERTFFIIPADTRLHLPTDLAGITCATFEARDDNNYEAALNPACVKIKKIIKDTGIRQERQEESTCKNDIDERWSSLIYGATKSVRIFAGDISWVPRDQTLIQEKIKEGVEFYVLCEKPVKEGLIKNNVLKLIDLGVNIKYYSEGHETSLRGLIIDGESPQLGVVLIIEKIRKKNMPEIKGLPGDTDSYKYRAIYYYPDNNLHITTALFQYFKSLYKFSEESIIFEKRELSKEEILKFLKKVDQYRDLEEKDIEIKTIALREVWACCQYVKLEKINKFKSFIASMENQRIPLFNSCLCINYNGEKIILPPILEKHGTHYVVIDGMHRLYQHFILNKKTKARCLVIQGRTALPSAPVQFNTVKITNEKYPREASFINYNEKLFRNIKDLDEILDTDYSSPERGAVI